MTRFPLIPIGETLVTYYMLPLVGVNKTTFAKHFKTSYVDRDGLRIYVELKSNMVKPLYRTNPNYITELLVGGVRFIQFIIPSEFIECGRNFVLGKYSQMSPNAKKLIYTTSTLAYNKKMGSFTQSHPILQALDKTKTLRSFLYKELGISNLPNSAELIDLPKKEWFIENRLKK